MLAKKHCKKASVAIQSKPAFMHACQDKDEIAQVKMI
jgi:hypothetical protein